MTIRRLWAEITITHDHLMIHQSTDLFDPFSAKKKASTCILFITMHSLPLQVDPAQGGIVHKQAGADQIRLFRALRAIWRHQSDLLESS